MARIDQLSYYPALTERITALAGQGLGNAAIAGQLAAEGFRTPRLHERFHDGEIQHLIRRLGLRPGLDHDHRTDHGSLGPGQWWLATLAREIGHAGGDLVRMAQTRLGPAGKTPGRPTGGSSPQTPPKSNASARCTGCQPATTTGAAGPTTAPRSTPRRTRSPITMEEKTYAARTEATTSPPGSARGRRKAAGTRAATPGRW